MSNHQSKRKLMAMMLSVIMGVSLMPALASAEASTLPVDTRGELIAFETLEKDIEVQNVPFGTSEANLNLPDALTVTVRLEEALSDSDIVNESTTDVDEAHDTIRNAGAPSENKEESSPAEGEEEDTTVKDEMETATSNDEEEYSPSEKEDKNTNSAEEITVSLPVTWYATPKYNSEASGTYVFTPNFSEGITVARGVEMPTISVTVGVATILAFDALPDDIRWQNTTSPVFPEALGGTTEDDDVQISVTWEADHDYDADYPVKGLYVFTAVLDEGYIVADGIELPRITVYIPQTAGRRMALMSRMAGGGTTDSPLEITTPAQLAEIAQLVNAGRLEAFLFNNSIDTIYLELKNDLNLFDYGASFHDGKGWTPIGTQANPFKGYFDGNGNKIEGLYIDDTSLSNAGLFGSVKGGMVQNLILTDANVRGSKEIGGIAGRIEDATIKNCGITGSVRGNENIGGIVGGIFENGTVEHCYTTGSVISTNNNAGGIAGNLNTATSIVRNCYSTSLLVRSFSGVFDGDGHIIKGLYINSPSSNNCGLFGHVNYGTVINLGIVDAYINGGYNVGGISGGMIGTVENCFITGKINGASSVGGMIGDLNSSTSKIINCYSAASVSGNEQVGGFIGRSNMGCVINSYSTGAISGEDKVGGIIGFFYGVSGSEVKNCAALNPSVRGSSNVSRVIGLYENNGVISNNYAYAGMTVTIGGVVQTITDGTANNIKGLAKTANELQSISGFPSVFSSAPWTYIEKKLPGLWGNAIDMPIHLLATDTSPFGGGDGTSEAQAYEISTAAQLAKLAELVSSDNESIRNAYNSKYYKLTNDIDLSAYGKNYDNGKGWLPIGRKAGAEIIAPIWWFRGTFDGNGKVITGLYINRPDEGFVGLFGYAMGAKIINIAVVGANVYGDFSVGGIAGIMSNNGTIQNCYVSGTISGDRSVGGIVGHFNSNMQQIKNCRSDASVIGNRDTIGGIVAITYGKIENCYATGLVSGGNRVGGIAGDVQDMYAYVRNCVALNPAIIATGENAGRVAGISSGQLINNYAFSGMKVNGTIITGGGGNNNNGADLSISKAHTASFWSTASNWDFFTWNSSPWAITDNKLPILTAVPASIQSGDSGVYLTERDMAYADCSIDEDTFTYNGSPQIPALTVTFDGTVLVQDVDYAVDITSSDGSGTSAGTKVGQVTLTISGKGNFKGETEVTYTILPKLLHNDMLSISGDSFVYTGTPHTPAVTIINDIPLISGIDYVVSYSDNINAGEATVIVTGIGNYSGTPNTTFTIQKAAAPSITWPTATNVTYGTALSESTLSGGSTEYGSFAWKAPKTIPTVTNSGYEVVFTPSADTLNNYEPIGETSKIFPITVTPKDIAELTVNTIAPITYTGTAQTPVTIKHGSLTLVLNKDYTATYSNNVNVGEATVVIEGKGNYIGSQSLNFTIAKRPITIKADNKTMIRGRTLPDFTYTVDGQLPGETALVGTPVLTCTADGKTLGDFPITLDLTGVSYTANYEAASPVFVNGTLTVKNPSSDSSGGDSSSISGGATISSKKKEPHQPVTSETSVTATLDQNGVAHANISDNIITFAITKAQENAKKQGKATNSISVNLNVTIPKGTNSLSLTLSNNAIDSIVNAGVTNLTIHNGIAPLVLDREALKEIQKQSDGTITITIHPVQNHSLSEKAKKLIGTRPVYDITVTSSKDGKNKNITSLGKGSATLALPYTPNENEAIGYLFGVYVDDNGNATRIPDSAYDAQSGSILMNTTHFSIYGVGYESPSEKYTDAATHWAKESIDYVVGRGLFSGTTDVTFSPDSTMNRGMLITVLGRLSGADVSSYTTSSFADVAVGKYYQPYIQWAYKKGIISTLGNGNFEPERPATREEIALMLQNYANATSYKLPVIHKAIPFADASSIGDGYNCAVTALQQAGIMIGDTSNKLNPKSSTTRAEISSMLHRYIKLTIDPATAHGWALNDMGQYLYYKNGKALTGTQTIDGAKYFFNTDGTLKTGWVNDGDNWRYYNGKKLLTGWQSIGSNSSIQTYYFDTYGTMVSGKWQQIDDTWYYFHADGSLAKNTTIDGYNVDDTGARKNK